jgi:Mg-chelatase subunit ChlD
VTPPADGTAERQADRYQGFRLESVCWGYRGIFEESIERLLASGAIGPDRPEVTAKFFEMMRGAEEAGFDRVLKDFLAAINPRTRWILDIPEVFADVVDTGRLLAGAKHYYGSTFFETLGRGGLGSTPGRVRELMTLVRRVREVSDQLAVALVRGYARLLGRLSPGGVAEYVRWGIEVYSRNADTGLRFMEGLLRSSEDYINHIGRACLLRHVRPSLERLLRALVGRGVKVDDLGALDSDALLERGSRTVCLYRWLYLPASCSHFASAAGNREWYTLAGVCAAGMLAARSFPAIHGHRDYGSCADLVGGGRAEVNLLTVIEYARVLDYVRANWPGATGLLARGLAAEFRAEPPASLLDDLLLRALNPDAEPSPASLPIRQALGRCGNVFDAAEQVKGELGDRIRAEHPALGSAPMRIISFLPDFGYPGEVQSPPPDSLVVDLRESSRREQPPDEDRDGDREPRDRKVADSRVSDESTKEGDSQGRGVEAGYVYDEWSHFDGDYYRDYCVVREARPEGSPGELPPGFDLEARRVRRAFELLRPNASRREKRLPEGEIINHDRLVDFMVGRRRDPSPRVDFYERPSISRRDVAVLILLDVSGSTGAVTSGEHKVIDSEKGAAVVLAQALAALGDRFAVCGFSGQGREDCRYWVYKDFEERWGEEALQRVLAARPATGTRIGAALRHSGYRLSRVEARQRLVLLVTDGKPLDVDYDPNTRYAQYDVRKACQENRRLGVTVLCISTDGDSRADMGIMFPRGRFAILRNLDELPRRLAGLYIRLTK